MAVYTLSERARHFLETMLGDLDYNGFYTKLEKEKSKQPEDKLTYRDTFTNEKVLNDAITNVSLYVKKKDHIIRYLNDFMNTIEPGVSQTIDVNVVEKLKECIITKQAKYSMYNDDKYFCIMGTVFFAKDYDKYTVRKLMGDSSNCLFFKADYTKTESNGNDKVDKLFVKVVQFPIIDQDIVMVDNINGFIINEIIKFLGGSIHSKHFMTYRDSFLSFRKRYGNDYYWRVDELADIRNDMSPLSLQHSGTIQSKFFTSELAHISIFNAINGVSIMSLIEKAIRTSNKSTQYMLENLDIIMKLTEFMRSVEVFGAEWGMIHNDLHTGNMFYDYDTKTIRMIDYGRMHFGAKIIYENKEIDKFIANEIIRNCAPDLDGKITYNDLMNTIHHKNKNTSDTKTNSNYFLGYFADFITLAGNLYEYYINAKLPLYVEIHSIVSIYLLEIQNMTHSSRTQWRFRLKCNDIYNLMINRKVAGENMDVLLTNSLRHHRTYAPYVDGLQSFWSSILDGLFCMCVTLLNLNYNSSHLLSFQNAPFYVYFQLNQGADFTKLINDLKALHITWDNSPLARVLKTTSINPTGGSRRTTKQKGGTNTFTTSPVPPLQIPEFIVPETTTHTYSEDIDYFSHSYANVLQRTYEHADKIKNMNDTNFYNTDSHQYPIRLPWAYERRTSQPEDKPGENGSSGSTSSTPSSQPPGGPNGKKTNGTSISANTPAKLHIFENVNIRPSEEIIPPQPVHREDVNINWEALNDEALNNIDMSDFMNSLSPESQSPATSPTHENSKLTLSTVGITKLLAPPVQTASPPPPPNSTTNNTIENKEAHEEEGNGNVGLSAEIPPKASPYPTLKLPLSPRPMAARRGNKQAAVAANTAVAAGGSRESNKRKTKHTNPSYKKIN